MNLRFIVFFFCKPSIQPPSSSIFFGLLYSILLFICHYLWIYHYLSILPSFLPSIYLSIQLGWMGRLIVPCEVPMLRPTPVSPMNVNSMVPWIWKGPWHPLTMKWLWVSYLYVHIYICMCVYIYISVNLGPKNSVVRKLSPKIQVGETLWFTHMIPIAFVQMKTSSHMVIYPEISFRVGTIFHVDPIPSMFCGSCICFGFKIVSSNGACTMLAVCTCKSFKSICSNRKRGWFG